MKVGIGYANEADAFASGIKIAQEALENGKISDPDLVLAFCQGDLDHAKYLAGITTTVGEAVPVIGGSAIGVITNEAISYSGHPAGAVIFSSAHSTFNWAFADAIDKGEETATATLAKQIVQTPNDKILFVFYDSVKHPATAVSPPTMNASPLIIKGLEEHLQTPAPIIGAGVIGRADFQPTQQSG